LVFNQFKLTIANFYNKRSEIALKPTGDQLNN
jgi:hypothetical protein